MRIAANIQHITPSFRPENAAQFGVARDNYQWFAANFQMIADKNAPAPHLFHWNSVQRHLDHVVNSQRNVFGGGRYLIVKARQMGVSTYVTNRSSHRSTARPHYQAMHFAHETDATELMLSMVKMSYNALPSAVKLPSGEVVQVQPARKKSNFKELLLWYDDVGTLNSCVRVKTAGGKEGGGRAFALNLVHFSELGDHEAYDDGKIVGGTLQTLSKNAEVFGEGTPNGAYGLQYELYQAAKAGDNEWTPIFLPWFWMDEYSIPLREGEVIEPDNEFEHRLMRGLNTHENYKVKPGQLKWMRWKIKSDCPPTIEMSPLEWFIQEYAHNDVDCFLTKGTTYFKPEYVAKMRAEADKYEKSHEVKRYRRVGEDFTEDPYGPLRLVEGPQRGATYIIGGDVAEGLEYGDYDTATIIKRCYEGPDVVVGYWRTHELDKGTHAYEMAQLGHWFNRALIAVENNKHGISVNEHLDALHYPRIYVQTLGDEGRFAPGIKPKRPGSHIKHVLGFETNKKTKAIFLGDQHTALRKWCDNKHDGDGLMVPFSAICEEYRTYQFKDGKANAADGCYDDLVISTGIANHLRDQVRPTRATKGGDGEIKPRPVSLKGALGYFGFKTAQEMIDAKV